MEIVDWEQGRKTELFKGSRERATPFLIPPPPLPGRPSYMLLCSKTKVRYLTLTKHCEGEEEEESTFDILVTLKLFSTSAVCFSHSTTDVKFKIAICFSISVEHK